MTHVVVSGYQLTLHHPCHPSFLSLVFVVTSYHCLSSLLMSSLVIVIILVICLIVAYPHVCRCPQLCLMHTPCRLWLSTDLASSLSPSFLSLVFVVTSYHCLSSLLMSSLVIVIILVICLIVAYPHVCRCPQLCLMHTPS